MKSLTFNIPTTDNITVNDLIIVSSYMGKVPSRIFIHDSFSSKSFNEFLSKEKIDHRIVNSDLIPNFGEYISNDRSLIRLDTGQWISYLSVDNIVSDVCILHDGEYDTILSKIKECSVDYEDESLNRTNILSVSNGVLELNPLYIQDEISISECHHTKSVKKIKKIVKSIESEDNSISIIRGPRGSGKTTICKWITNQLDIITIFIPNNLIDHTINNPDFRNFISKFEECLIVIDDCEFNYSNGRSSSPLTCNIIQISETYATDNIHFILSFNVDDSYEIDEEFYECGSFENEVFIDLPNGEFSTEISKKIGMSVKYNSEESLSNIFKGKKTKINNKNIGIE